MTDLPDPIDAERLALADRIAGDLGPFSFVSRAERDLIVSALRAPRRDEPVNGRAIKALTELTAMVRGECPSLLNEDSGGNARLSIEIDDILAHPAASQGGVPGCGVPGCNDPTCDYGQEPAPSRPAPQPGEMREKVVALVLSAMVNLRDPGVFGASHAKKMNRQVAEKFADSILSLTPASANEVKP